jgi:F-type H+-transporting ATPase subunit c
MEGVFYAKAAALFGAALAMGIGTCGPAFGQGMIGSKGIEGISKAGSPEQANTIRNSMLLAMSLVETSGVFVFVISILLIFRNS